MKLFEMFSEDVLSKLKEKLGEDSFAGIEEAAKEIEIDLAEQKFIPYNRFKEVNEQAKDYKSQIDEREKQLNELQEKFKDNDELLNQINTLKESNEKTKVEYESKIKQRDLDYTIETLSLKNGVKNAKAFKALLDLENIGDDYSKLDEQVKAIKESDPYLFNIEEEQPPKKAGFTPAKNDNLNDEFASFRKM